VSKPTHGFPRRGGQHCQKRTLHQPTHALMPLLGYPLYLSVGAGKIQLSTPADCDVGSQ